MAPNGNSLEPRSIRCAAGALICNKMSWLRATNLKDPRDPKGRRGEDLTATIGHPIVDYCWDLIGFDWCFYVFFVFPTLEMVENTVKMVM